MDENPPPRRWYQFRLSTILVLVAITAWVMARFVEAYLHTPYFECEIGGWMEARITDWKLVWTLKTPDGLGVDYMFYIGLRRGFGWLLLALAAFLTWKWVAARRKRLACTQS